MHPFDKERIIIANRLYSLISNVEDDDQIMLRELINEAVKELGISFIRQDLVASLTNKCNPQKYMNPYNEEKVALASELYAILSKDNLTYDDVCLVEEKVEALQ